MDLRKINKKMPSWGQDLKHLEGVQPLRIYYDVQPLRSWNSAIHMELFLMWKKGRRFNLDGENVAKWTYDPRWSSIKEKENDVPFVISQN